MPLKPSSNVLRLFTSCSVEDIEVDDAVCELPYCETAALRFFTRVRTLSASKVIFMLFDIYSTVELSVNWPSMKVKTILLASSPMTYVPAND